MDPSKDLLAFVTALDAHSSSSDEGDNKRVKKGRDKKKKSERKESFPPVDNSAVSISDFAALLGGEESSSTKRKRGTDAPLPKTVQSKLERKVAWEQTQNDVTGRWEPFVQRVKEAPTLKFPLNPVQVPNMQTVESQMAHFQPQNDFERGLADVLSRTDNKSFGDAELPGAEMTTELPESTANPKLAKKAADAAKDRAMQFYKEQKQKHSSKIKSKTYRKHLAKDKARKALKAKLENDDGAMTLHEREQDREQAELARIRERFSLRTHKAGKWAHDLLLNKKAHREFRAGLSAQVKEQQMLREQIMGKAAAHQEEDDDDDEDDDVYEELDEEEVENLERLKAELEMTESEEELPKVVARRKFGPPLPAADISEEEQLKVISASKDSTITASRKGLLNNKAAESDTDDKEDSMSMMMNSMQARLNRNQQIADLMFKQKQPLEEEEENDSDSDGGLLGEEFQTEKAKLVKGEAPRTEDMTLPGWGNWSGPGTRAGPPRVQVLKHVPGIDPRKRKDAHLDHVILTEKKLKSAVQKYTVEKVPMPFENREQYEAHLALPVGPEWNTPAAHKRLTAPKIIAPVGSVIKAPKLPHKN